MKFSTLLLVALSLVLAGLAVGGAVGASGGEAGRPRAAASIYPVSMLVEEIGGERVGVTTIIGAGLDPHHFEPTPSSAKAVLESDVVFLIGGDFDSHLPGGNPGAAQLRVAFSEALSDSLIALGNTFNPHFWLDTLLAATMGDVIGLALMKVDPAGSTYYEKRLARFHGRMDSLHAEVGKRLAEAGVGAFVSFHPAWTYFARRYGLTEIGVVQRFPEHEPSARWVADLILEIKRHGTCVLIVEEASDPGVVRGIEEDTGARVVMLDPIGDPDDAGRRDYFSLIRHNVSLLVKPAEGE